VIHEEFGVDYHPGHVRKLLHRLGCSVQRPTTRLVQADPKAQNKWIRYTYPNLKKRQSRRRGNRFCGRGVLSPEPDPASNLGAFELPA
jgi:hypothetical protein